MKHKIYFHANKYKIACELLASIDYISDQFGSHHKIANIIFININKLLYDTHKHDVLNCLPDFDARFNLVVSHEIIHNILTKYIGSMTSSQFDALVVKYWLKHIDLNTNYDVKYE